MVLPFLAGLIPLLTAGGLAAGIATGVANTVKSSREAELAGRQLEDYNLTHPRLSKR